MLSKNQIKEIQSLQLKKMRDLKRLFLAEGVKTALEIFEKDPSMVSSVFATADFLSNHGNLLNKLKLSYTTVTDEELKKISFLSSPNGVLVVCHYFSPSSAITVKENVFSIYLDDIRDPGNFGTIVRLAAWYGIDTIYCSAASCDLYNPKVIQSTMGAFLKVKVVYKELEWILKEKIFTRVYGAVLDGGDLYKVSLSPGLIVIGNEANGISDQTLRMVTDKITIPTATEGSTESLNAAMAASIITSEFYRQLHY